MTIAEAAPAADGEARRFKHRDGWLDEDCETRDHESYMELQPDGSTWWVQRATTTREQCEMFAADGTWVEQPRSTPTGHGEALRG